MQTCKLTFVAMAVGVCLSSIVRAEALKVTTESFSSSENVNYSAANEAVFVNDQTATLSGFEIKATGTGTSDQFQVVRVGSQGSNTSTTLFNLGSESTSDISISGDNSANESNTYGILTQRGRTVVSGKSLKVNLIGNTKETVGIVAQGFGQQTDLILSEVIINTDRTVLNLQSASPNKVAALMAFGRGKLTINSDLEINAPTAIVSRGYSVVQINPNGNAVVKMNGNVDFNFNEETAGTAIEAEVNINLTNKDSYWSGNAIKSGNPPSGKDKVTGMALSLSNQAQWTTDKDSFVNTLTVNDGIINVTGNSKQTVTVGALKGQGAVVNLAVGKTGSTYETPKVEVDSTKADPTTTIEVVATGINADNADVDVALAAINSAVTGVAKTAIIQEGDIFGAVSQTYAANGQAQGQKIETKNSKQDAYQSLTALNAMTWRHDMNDLTKRMGELRDSSAGIGSWVRLYGSEQEYGDQNLKTKNTSIQVGTDFPVGDNWKMGAALSYTNGDTSYAAGSADSDAYSGAIYGSWLSDSGQFVDLIAKYTRMKTDFQLSGFSGSQDNDALSISAEYGWHLKLNDMLFVEPQAELTYGRVFGDTFEGEANQTMTIDQEDFDSLIGRIGIRTGLYFSENKGTVYARVSGAYDFQGEYEYTAVKSGLNQKFKNDLGGAWVEYAVGANFNLSENAYTYVDLERTSGGEVTENWRWNLGLRYVW